MIDHVVLSCEIWDRSRLTATCKQEVRHDVMRLRKDFGRALSGGYIGVIYIRNIIGMVLR